MISTLKFQLPYVNSEAIMFTSSRRYFTIQQTRYREHRKPALSQGDEIRDPRAESKLSDIGCFLSSLCDSTLACVSSRK